MTTRFNNLAIRLNERILASNKSWLKKAYPIVREFGTYAVQVPLFLLKPLSNDKSKFVIYAQARTGSTLLIDLLNSNPALHCDREIFAFRAIFTEEFLNAPIPSSNWRDRPQWIAWKRLMFRR